MVTQDVISVPALVMKILEPSTTHSSASSRPVVRLAPAVELLRDRGDAFPGEPADRVPDQLVLRLEVEVHGVGDGTEEEDARRRRTQSDVRHPPTVEALTEEIGRIVSERQTLRSQGAGV